MRVDVHKYFVNDKPVRRSCTTFIHDNFDEFEAAKFAANSARKRTFSVAMSQESQEQVVKCEWDRASYVGSCVHELIENYYVPKPCLNNRDWYIKKNTSIDVRNELDGIYKNTRDGVKEEIDLKYKQFLSAVPFLPVKFLASEYMVYGEVNQELVSGTIDALFWTNEEKREVAIVDWKTNKEVVAFKSRVARTDSPFHKQQHTKLVKYECQLHVYQKLLEEYYNVTVTHLVIVHLTIDNFTIFSRPLKKNCCCIGGDDNVLSLYP